jgi:hypothetical protein
MIVGDIIWYKGFARVIIEFPEYDGVRHCRFEPGYGHCDTFIVGEHAVRLAHTSEIEWSKAHYKGRPIYGPDGFCPIAGRYAKQFLGHIEKRGVEAPTEPEPDIIRRIKIALLAMILAAAAAGLFCLIAFAFYHIRIELVNETGGLCGHIIWGISVLIFMLVAGYGIKFAIRGDGEGNTRTF